MKLGKLGSFVGACGLILALVGARAETPSALVTPPLGQELQGKLFIAPEEDGTETELQFLEFPRARFDNPQWIPVHGEYRVEISGERRLTLWLDLDSGSLHQRVASLTVSRDGQSIAALIYELHGFRIQRFALKN